MVQRAPRAAAAVLLALLMPAPAGADGPGLEQARILYNEGRYQDAIRVAESFVDDPQRASSARLIIGRSELERFRALRDAATLARAREALRAVDAGALDTKERVELTVGLAEALFFDDAFRAAADVFSGVLDVSAYELGPAARDQLLDWWATALDRHARTLVPADRPIVYQQIAERMERVLAREPSAAASYWLVVAARERGDLDRAWDAAMAGWVRAQLTPDRGASLRPDLDRLVTQSIIPERARRLPSAQVDTAQAIAGMTAEWEHFKAKWTN